MSSSDLRCDLRGKGFGPRLLAAACALLMLPAVASAQQPSMTTLVVPFATGGSTDAMARLLQPGLQARLGRTVVVENKAGAASSLGAAAVAKSPPDGSTLLVAFDSHAVIPALLDKPALDIEKDLLPVLLIGTAPYVIATKTDKPFKSFADVIATEKASPGAVKYASTGVGTIGHLAVSLLSKKSGVNLAHVAYRSGGLALNDVIGGHVDLLAGSVALIAPHMAQGTLRPVMQMGARRLDALPDTQTATEAGFPDFEAVAWWGVFAPAGMKPELVESLSQTMKAVLSDETIANRMKETQQMTVILGGPAEFRPFFKKQIEVWGSVVRDNGIKAQQ